MQVKVNKQEYRHEDDVVLASVDMELEFIPDDEAEHERLAKLISEDARPAILIKSACHADKLQARVAIFLPKKIKVQPASEHAANAIAKAVAAK